MPPKRPPKQRGRGAQPGNSNARRHGAFAAPTRKLETIDDIIADMQARQEQISELISQAMTGEGHTTTEDLIKLFAIHGQGASRLGRLLRDQRALSGQSADGLSAAIAAALDELSTELGITL
jgi:hypothetical protein